jgi:hypothetical protein
LVVRKEALLPARCQFSAAAPPSSAVSVASNEESAMMSAICPEALRGVSLDDPGKLPLVLELPENHPEASWSWESK